MRSAGARTHGGGVSRPRRRQPSRTSDAHSLVAVFGWFSYVAGMKTKLSVTEAKTKLLRLVESKETITLRQREETVAFIVPRERMEALLETMEIMADPVAMRAIRRDQSGKGKYVPLSDLDENEG